MMNIPWEEFWWNNITGPHIVVTNVTNALLENKMVVLKVPSDLPWRHSMRSAIYTAFREKSDFGDVVIEPIDGYDDNPNNFEPGRFILNRFASSIINKGYRERSKVTIQKYISAKNVIKNRVIWVKGLNKKTAAEWIEFCSGFSERTAADGLFVLEVHGDVLVPEAKIIRFIEFSACVSSYDVQLFNSFILDEQNLYSEMWKKYVSTCAATVCDIDAEISELLIRVVDFKMESAIEGIKRIVEMPEFSRRGKEDSSHHILWCYRSGDMAELEHRIWVAQIQVLFPVIELERVKIIHRYEADIQKVLDSGEVIQYGEIIHDAIDVELGSLCYLMSKKDYEGFYMLYIPDESDRSRIMFLHDCRNNLAHASCCSPGQVFELLG